MKELKVEVPKGYEIDKESSTFECVKFKPVRSIKTIEDLHKSAKTFVGYWEFAGEVYRQDNLCHCEKNNNAFLSEKEVKSALAMAQISQLMPYYGGAITDEEWESKDIYKIYTIERAGNKIHKDSTCFDAYRYLAFRTKEQRDSFLENNEQLVKDYLMLD